MTSTGAASTSSRAAQFGAMLGIAAVVFVIGGVASAALQILPPFSGFLLMVLGLGLSLVGTVTSIVGLVATSPSRGRAGRSSALRGFALSLVTLVAIAIPASRGRDVPRINDITTDLDNPPVFVTTAQNEDNRGRDMPYPGASFAEQQQKAYPDLASLVVADEPPAAFERVRAALGAMPNMEIVGESRDEGRIEATETSALFHFADDVVVRIKSFEGSGSRIDVRSKSRVGQGDLGVNAKRIRTLFGRLRAANPPPGD